MKIQQFENSSVSELLDRLVYRCEGNVSIVFGLSNRGKVLKLLKCPIEEKNREDIDIHIKLKETLMRNLDYVNNVIKPLAKNHLSRTFKLVHVDASFVGQLAKKVESHRPIERLSKGLLLEDQYGLLMDDLCAIPNWLTCNLEPGDLSLPKISIEIKPKQGFLLIPDDSTCQPRNSGSKKDALTKSCLYGFTQYQKLEQGRIDHVSNYCPLKFFSGCPLQMKDSLIELFKNPQNNLRIFKDFQLEFDSNSKSSDLPNILEGFLTEKDNSNSELKKAAKFQDLLIDLIIKCLLDDHILKIDEEVSSEDEKHFNSSQHGMICSKHYEKFSGCQLCDNSMSEKSSDNRAKLDSHVIPNSSVLSKVLEMQKLDTIGPKKAKKMLDYLRTANDKSEIDVMKELSLPQALSADCGVSDQLDHESKDTYYCRKLREFLVSLTAKDCSIIIAMQRVSSDRLLQRISSEENMCRHLLKDDNTGAHYMFHVGIADLDQKMPYRIEKACNNLVSMLYSYNNLTKREIPML